MKRRVYPGAFFLLAFLAIKAQEGINAKYVFPQSMFDSFLIKRAIEVPDTFGYFLSNNHKAYIVKDAPKQSIYYEHFSFTDSLNGRAVMPRTLAGSVITKSGDTVFVSLWHFKHGSKLEEAFPDVAGQQFIYIIKPWVKHSAETRIPRNQRYKGLAALPKWYFIPFKHMYLGATTIPFRVRFWDGAVDKDFLNANVSFGYLWGRTRFYKYSDIHPRNFSVGIGAFLGLVQINDSVANKGRLGYSCGVHFMANVYNNLSVLLAVGTNNNFSKRYNKEAANADGSTNWKGLIQPYVGLGFGYGLYSLYQIGTQKK